MDKAQNLFLISRGRRAGEFNFNNNMTNSLKQIVKQKQKKKLQNYKTAMMDDSKSEHNHFPGCGHTMIFHDKHVGYLQDGQLYCVVDASKPSTFVEHQLGGENMQCHGQLATSSTQPTAPSTINLSGPTKPDHGHSHSHGHGHSHDHGHGHSHDHGHSHGKPSTPSTPSPTTTTTTPAAVRKSFDEEKAVSHALAHIHGDGCGHEKLLHGDHYDYIVGNERQSLTTSEKCGKINLFVSRHDLYDEIALRSKNSISSSSFMNLDDDKFKDLGIKPSAELLRFFVTQKSWRHDLSGTQKRFVIMLFLTGSFFFVELLVGVYAGSLALISDAFHMLSDLISLIIGFAAIKITSQVDRMNTFHYARAEVLGALVNAIFLIAICFKIAIEAISRFFESSEGESLGDHGELILIVGGVGLLMNVIGIFLFGSHGHSHGGGGGGHGHAHGGSGEAKKESHGHGHGHGHAHGEEHGPKMNMNVHGVLLHIIGDALGSVAAMVSGATIWLSDSPYRTLSDPLCTLFIGCIILVGAIPLVKTSIPILLDSVPKGIDRDSLEEEIQAIPGVEGLHDLHIWSISPEKIIGSMHVILRANTDTNTILIQLKMICHRYSIHSTTIQVEFLPSQETDPKQFRCIEPFCHSKRCLEAFCCLPSPNQ
eukprot:c20155_g1_i1.p1 GENE.c20155_g1_i1~~c20155_g1_i1.p1  ORF type:complete len:650 (-),score=252.33 c20155_g1_i1:215-2164(-)